MDYEIKVYGTETCPDTLRSRQHLADRGLEYEFIDINEDEDAEEQVIEWGAGKRKIPVIEINNEGETQRLTEPSNDELDEALPEDLAA